MSKEAARTLAERWEMTALKQRELAQEIRNEPGLKASMLATSNAWMMAASDLRKTAGIVS